MQNEDQFGYRTSGPFGYLENHAFNIQPRSPYYVHSGPKRQPFNDHPWSACRKRTSPRRIEIGPSSASESPTWADLGRRGYILLACTVPAMVVGGSYLEEGVAVLGSGELVFGLTAALVSPPPLSVHGDTHG